jgi:hypothetical protein
MDGGFVVITQTVIRGNAARHWGGGLVAHYHAHVTIREQSVITGNTARDGGGIWARSPPGRHRTQVFVVSSGIHGNNASQAGGGLMVTDSAHVTIIESQVSGNTAAQGGGLFGQSGTVHLRNATHFFNNTASVGASLHLPGSAVYVFFPLVPGYWLPNSECRVYRQPCPQGDVVCQQHFDACSHTPDTIISVGSLLNSTTPAGCSPRTFIQPCDWMNDPKLLTSPPTNVYAPPNGIPIDITFPYVCGAGLLGSADVQFQTSSMCAGQCPTGYSCLTPATTAAMICAPGSYCPEGTTVPLRCASGTFRATEGGRSQSDCARCPPGSACPQGTALPAICRPGTYSGSGAATCTKCEPGKFTPRLNTSTCSWCLPGHWVRARSEPA